MVATQNSGVLDGQKRKCFQARGKKRARSVCLLVPRLWLLSHNLWLLENSQPWALSRECLTAQHEFVAQHDFVAYHTNFVAQYNFVAQNITLWLNLILY